MGLSAEIGLDAVLPNMRDPEASVDPAWVFTVRPDLRHWDYRGDRDVFGFDPSGRMLYFGKTHAGEDVWLVLAPEECIGPYGTKHDLPKKMDAPARMDRKVANVIWAFLSVVFSRVQYSDFALRDDYPDISSEAKLELSTDIL